MQKKKLGFLETLSTFEFVEGQGLWDRRHQGVSSKEFKKFENRKWGWVASFVPLERLAVIGYLLLVMQSVILVRGSLNSLAVVLSTLNPINAFLSLAGAVFVTFGPLIILTREFRNFENNLPKDIKGNFSYFYLPLLALCPMPIVWAVLIINIVYFGALAFSKSRISVLRLRIWALFNLPSLSAFLIGVSLTLVFFTTPSFPTVTISKPGFAQETFYLVNSGTTPTLVNRETGSVLIDSQQSFGAIETCGLPNSTSSNLLSTFFPKMASVSKTCPK